MNPKLEKAVVYLLRASMIGVLCMFCFVVGVVVGNNMPPPDPAVAAALKAAVEAQEGRQ